MNQIRPIYLTALVVILMMTINACVQKTYKRTVIFQVDTRKEADVQSLSVRGQMPPLNWNDNVDLSDADEDSIYTGEITFDTPYDFVELKFVKNGNSFELNDRPNRHVYFDGKERIEFNVVYDQMD